MKRMLILSSLVPLLLCGSSIEWKFDKSNDKKSEIKGETFRGALVAPNMGVNGSGALLCNGTVRNHQVLDLTWPEWSVSLDFKLFPRKEKGSRTIFAYERKAWNLSRFLLNITPDGRISASFRVHDHKQKKDLLNYVVISSPVKWQTNRWYSLRFGSKAGGFFKLELDGTVLLMKDKAPALTSLGTAKADRWYPQLTLGCDPAVPQKVLRPLHGVIDNVRITKRFGENRKDSTLGTASFSKVRMEKHILAGTVPHWTCNFDSLDKETEVLGAFQQVDRKFRDKTGTAAMTIENNMVTVRFRCPVPVGVPFAVKPSDPLWKECVEFFLRPNPEKGIYYHYAVGANNKTYSARNTAANSPDNTFKSAMKSSVRVTSNGYEVTLQIPVKELELENLAPGSEISGNFTRTGASCGGLATWAPMGRSFHLPEQFSKIIIGDYRSWFSKRIAALRKELSTMAAGDLLSRLDAVNALNSAKNITSADAENIHSQLENFRQAIIMRRLEGKKLLIWRPQVWENNIEVALTSQALDRITLSGARNSKRLFGFAVSNLSDQPFLGQIKLFPGEYPGKSNKSAFGYDAYFTSLFRQVRMYEGLPLHTSSGTACYDALAPLPMNTLVRIPPKTTVPLWAEFSTKNLPAGKYNGTLVLKSGYSGFPVEKIPFEFNCSSVDLGKTFVRNFNYIYMESRSKYNREISTFLAERGVNMIFIDGFANCYPKLDKNGNFDKADFSGFNKLIRNYLDAGIDSSQLGICVYLGWEHKWQRFYYRKFETLADGETRIVKSSTPPPCGIDNPVWEKAITRYLQLFVGYMVKEFKINPANIVFYPVDEPSGDPADKKSRAHLAIRYGKLIKKALPQCPVMTNPYISKMKPRDFKRALHEYCKVYDIIELYRPRATVASELEIVRKYKRKIWFYHIINKDTSPDVYRRFFWENFRDGSDDVASFWHIDAHAGGDGIDPNDSSGKNRTDYGAVYADSNFGKVISSRRMEAHVQGLYDYKAAKLCRELLKKSPNSAAQKKLDSIVKRAIAGNCDTMDACRMELIQLAETLQK